MLAIPASLEGAVLVPPAYNAAEVRDGVYVLIRFANGSNGFPSVVPLFFVVDLDALVAWYACVWTEEIVHAVKRVEERTDAPAKIEIQVDVWRVALWWVKFGVLGRDVGNMGCVWEARYGLVP